MTKTELIERLTARANRHDEAAVQTREVALPTYLGATHTMRADAYREALRLVHELEDDSAE